MGQLINLRSPPLNTRLREPCAGAEHSAQCVAAVAGSGTGACGGAHVLKMSHA